MEKSVDGVLGIRTRQCRIEGTDYGGPYISSSWPSTFYFLSTTQHAIPSFMLKVLERVGSNMAPTISNFLIEFTKNRSYYQMSPSSLLHYLDANLIFLKSNLVPENFKRVLSVIWSTSAASLSSILHEAIGRFFALFKNYHMTCLLFCVPNHLYPSFR